MKWILLLLVLPTVTALQVEIYSAYTTTPTFVCPDDAIKCELYQYIDSMNREIDPPKFIKECSPGICRYENHVNASFGFRFLPGDVSLGAGLFKGFKIIQGEATTTTTTTTSTPTETTTTLISCRNRPFMTCTSLPNCFWIGNPLSGYCSDSMQTTLTTTLQTTQLTTTTTFSHQCKAKGDMCQINQECCSGFCEKRCISSVFGICLFNAYVGRCS
ncbi:MAG: hypothetical protein QXM68_04390 [Candidatus Aenigmatarchaeota archaeon]|nr:hypothetical protein [Candidatus Aenigmarchaeota archaeon]